MQLTNLRKKFLASGTRFLDIVVMTCTFVFSLYMYAPEEYYPPHFIDFLSYKIKLVNIIAYIFLVIVWNRLFSFFGLYEIRRFGNIFREWFDIIKAISIGVLLVAAVGSVFGRGNVNNEVLLTFWGTSVMMTMLTRAWLRVYLAFLRHRGRNLRFVVFVGSNDRAIHLAQKVMGREELGFRLLGFVDNNFDYGKNVIPKEKRLCSLDDFPEFLENNVVDEVFIVLPINSFYEETKKIINLCEELGIVCRVPSNWFEFRTAKASAFDLDGIPILTVYTGSYHQLEYLWTKRLIDIVLASAALIVFSPVILIVAIVIKMTSEGPVFFSQDRIGYNRRRFKMIKFRTMVSNAEELQKYLEYMNEADGAAFKISDDPRITKIGRWLRKTSIDELPQLVNVLKGDMSLVGPRPLPVRDVKEIDERWQKRRFSMRPGLTCLWQINGRNRVLFRDWMKLDLEYIDKWSIKLDFEILVKTIPAVLRATGK